MAVSPLTVNTIARTGTLDTLAAANADGHTIANNGSMWFEVANGDATSTNVIVGPDKTVDGLAVASRTVAVAAGARRKFGPYTRADYGSSITVTFSKVTSLTVAAWSLA